MTTIPLRGAAARYKGRLMTFLLVGTLWGCGRPKECQLAGVSCSPSHTFTCDPCGTVYFCGVYQSGGGNVWGQSNWPCACIADNGTLLYDTATGTGDTACEKAQEALETQ